MKDIAQKYAELDMIRRALCEKIQKVHTIMFAQEICMLTPNIEAFRIKYLESLHRHLKIIEQEQEALLDQIDINQILKVLKI